MLIFKNKDTGIAYVYPDLFQNESCWIGTLLRFYEESITETL